MQVRAQLCLDPTTCSLAFPPSHWGLQLQNALDCSAHLLGLGYAAWGTYRPPLPEPVELHCPVQGLTLRLHSEGAAPHREWVAFLRGCLVPIRTRKRYQAFVREENILQR